MSVIGILMDEHRLIEQVLTCLERMVDDSEREQKLDAVSANDAITFLREFGDRGHHSKEENLLFPALESRGFSPHHGPTAVMRSEHAVGRKLICGMSNAVAAAGAGDAEAVSEFAKNTRAYVAMLREHIEKEDSCLFPMAEQSLDGPTLEELQRSFALVEQEEIGESLHLELLQLADRLMERFDVKKAELTACT